jgi:hypothetical protein
LTTNQRRRRRRAAGDAPPEGGQPANVDHRKGHRSHLRDGFPRDGGNRQPWRRRGAPAEETISRRMPGAERPGPRIWVEDAS